VLRLEKLFIRNTLSFSDSKSLLWQKLLVFETKTISNFKRVMLLDADIWINKFDENPFNLVPYDNWGLCKNNAFDLKTYHKSDLRLYNKCPLENRPDFVLNTGFYILNKNIHSKKMRFIFDNYDTQICEEQGPLSYHLLTEFPGVILPFKFNNIVASFMEKFGYSFSSIIKLYEESNFLHFAGNVNRKILRILILIKKFPIVLNVMKLKPILYLLDKLSNIIKKVKKI
jgi:hypothetical protein